MVAAGNHRDEGKALRSAVRRRRVRGPGLVSPHRLHFKC
jgi:hypothetical protein